MRQAIEVENCVLLVNDIKLCFKVYRNTQATSQNRLVCLHGAGVAGDDTFGLIIPHLSQWCEILVPDLRGMGQTQYISGEEDLFTLDDICGDIVTLLGHLDWQQFDLCGYSMGGLVAMLVKEKLNDAVKFTVLIEPALLDNQDIDETLEFRRKYEEVSKRLHIPADITEGVTAFLDLVSPNRTRNARSESIVMQRLSYRPLGFANALRAIALAAKTINRSSLIAQQNHVVSMVGGKSYQAMKEFHQRLARDHASWRFIEVPGADHSLIFQKPSRIIQTLNGLSQ